MKYYEFKTYSHNGEFKKQINPVNITDNINFTEELNGGQGNLNIKIIGNSEDYLCSDIVEIRQIENGVIKSTYTGIVERIGVEEYKSAEVINLELYGLHTLLNDIIYKDGASKTFTKTGTPGVIAKNIIDYFNTEYGVLTGEQVNLGVNIFDTTGIDQTGTEISLEFNQLNCLSALQLVIDNSDFDFYINQNGLVFFQKKENQIKVNLTFDKEIKSINKTIQKNDMVNRYYLTREGGIEKIYENTGYINTFNLKELSETRTDIQNEQTQDISGNKKINKLGLEIQEINLIIQETDLKPGDLVTTLNTNNQIIEKQIVRIQKRKNDYTIYLDTFTSFGKTINNLGKRTV